MTQQLPSEELKKVVRDFNSEIIQNGNWSRFGEFVHTEFLNHTAPSVADRNADGFKKFFQQILHPALSAIAVTICDQIAEGDRVATRKIIEGTHTGMFLGIAPTGKRISINVTDIVRLHEGKYFEHWGSADLLGAMNQMRST